jgi:glycosyltransferase involved in cell wall biosynthesis
MTRPRRIVQMFNARGGAAAPAGPDAYNPRREEAMLRTLGFDMETIPAFGLPFNPAARMHNAYLGLDPLRAIRILLTRRRAALICAHLESAVVLLLLRRLFRFRPPVVIWEVPFSPGWAFRERIGRLAMARADGAVVFSSSQIGLARQTYGAASPVWFIPFAVDLTFFRPAAGAGPGTILSAGRDAGRDFGIVVRAAQGLGVAVTIRAGGKPDALPAGVRWIEAHVPYAQYRALYEEAAIVVVATGDTLNACGVTSLMEAMAMGKPVIVSDNPALRDYLPPPDAGIVVPVGDEAALRAALRRLIDDPEEARRMGVRAREFAQRQFSPARHYTRMAEMFDRVIGETRD